MVSQLIWLFLNLYKPIVYFTEYVQTVQNQIRRRELIRFCNVSNRMYFKNLNKIINYYPRTLKLETDSFNW